MRRWLFCSLPFLFMACDGSRPLPGPSSNANGGTITSTGENGGAGSGGNTASSQDTTESSRAGSTSAPGGTTNSGGTTSNTGGTTAVAGNTALGTTTTSTPVSGGSTAAGSTSGGTTASGGNTRTGGTTKTGGTPATGGTTKSGGSTGSSSSTSSSSSGCNTTLPAYTSSQTVSATINISGVKDYNYQRFCADPNTLGPGDQSESQKPVFMLAKGATLRNVIVGGTGCSAADGIHCESGSCTLENVWIGDVGEDAITFKGSDTSQVMTITGGGAFEASDKVIQHNGPGTIKVNGFYVKNAGKLYRSCGNCSNNGFARHVEMTNIFATGVKVLAGINANYGDTATISSLTRCGTVNTICETFTGNSSGAEPPGLASYGPSGGDGKACIFTASAILK